MIAGGDGKPMLAGVRVIDLTSVVFGPYATQILADLGAEVIKIEAPAGDLYRYNARAAVTLGMGPGFLAINRGKRSITLDLKQPANAERLRALIEGADVVIHNIRGKAAAKLGLDYEAVKAIRADIIYVHCTGFGQDGPYAGLQAYDDVIQAASGTTTLLSRVDGDPRPRFLPSLVADKVAGLHGAYGVLAAIIHRMRTGEGQALEVPMFEAFTHFMLLEHLGGLTFDPPNAPVCYQRQIDPDRQPFPTNDGAVSIVPYVDAAWPRLFALLDDPEFLDDARFATRTLRVRNLPALYRRMAELTANFTTAELVRRCQAADIPAQAVRDIADIMTDPHLHATGFFQKRTHPVEGEWFAMKPAIRFGCFVPQADRPPPMLGEDNDTDFSL